MVMLRFFCLFHQNVRPNSFWTDNSNLCSDIIFQLVNNTTTMRIEQKMHESHDTELLQKVSSRQ